MAKDDPRQELMVTQQSLLEEYEHQLSCKIEETIAALSCLSQHEQEGKRVPCGEVQEAIE